MSPYFVSREIDSLLIGGASLLLLVPILYLPIAANPQIQLLALSLTNWPHLYFAFAFLYRRPEGRAFPGLRYGLPIVLTAVAALALRFPESLGRAFVTLGAAWNLYHVAAQAYGVTLVYARRSGIAIDSATRRSLAHWVYGSLAVAMLRFPQVALSRTEGLRLIEAWHATRPICGLVALAVIYAGRRFLITAWRARPAIFPLPALAFTVWCATPGTTFFFYLGAFHGLQYLLFAWVRRDRAATAGRWLAAMLLGGAAVQLGLRASAQFSATAFAICLTAVNCFHFIADGALWKIRRTPALLQ